MSKNATKEKRRRMREKQTLLDNRVQRNAMHKSEVKKTETTTIRGFRPKIIQKMNDLQKRLIGKEGRVK